jgi:hypothetical protein
MSTNIYLKLCEIFEIEPNNTIPNSVFNEIPEDCYSSWGGMPGQKNWWSKGVSSWNKGISPSEDTRKKISETNKKKNISFVSNGATEAARLANLGKKQTEEHIRKRISKRFRRCEVYGIEYESMKSACDALNIPKATMYKMVNRGIVAKYL